MAALVAVSVVAVTAGGSLWLSLAGIKRDPTLLPQRDQGSVSYVAGALNLLLVGVDSHQPGREASVLMLVHVDSTRQRIHLISLPRELLSPVEGGGTDRLSLLYAKGGSVAVVESIEELLGIHMDHVALTWLNGMSRLIDLLGGIPVDNPIPTSNSGIPFPRGQITLSGEESLAFVPEGASGPGQLDRAECQRLVLQGIATRLLTSNALSNPGTVKAVLDQLATDVVVDSRLDARRMVELFVGLRTQPNVQDLQAIKLPTADRGTTPTGEGFVLPDAGRVTSLGRAINNDTLQDWMLNR